MPYRTLVSQNLFDMMVPTTAKSLTPFHPKFIFFSRNSCNVITTVLLDAVLKPSLKIVHNTGQQLTIYRTYFLTDDLLQIIQRTGFVSVNTRFQITPKKKLHFQRLGERRGHCTSPKPEIKCPGDMFWTMVIDSFAVCAVAPSCWNHTLARFIILRRSPHTPLGLPT